MACQALRGRWSRQQAAFRLRSFSSCAVAPLRPRVRRAPAGQHPFGNQQGEEGQRQRARRENHDHVAANREPGGDSRFVQDPVRVFRAAGCRKIERELVKRVHEPCQPQAIATREAEVIQQERVEAQEGDTQQKHRAFPQQGCADLKNRIEVQNGAQHAGQALGKLGESEDADRDAAEQHGQGMVVAELRAEELRPGTRLEPLEHHRLIVTDGLRGCPVDRGDQQCSEQRYGCCAPRRANQARGTFPCPQ